MLGPLRLGEALGALAMGHVMFAGAGIINAAVQTPPRSPSPLASAPLATTAVAKVVTAMYSGAGIDGAALSDDATFTDPAAACVGRAEVVEAFRALGACSPEHVAPPLAVSERTVSTAGGTGDDGGPATGAVHVESEFFLHQRYFKGAYYSGLVVRSTLVVRADNAGRICAVEERWNGAPLLRFSAFRFARRVNGMLSALLTPYVSRTG